MKSLVGCDLLSISSLRILKTTVKGVVPTGRSCDLLSISSLRILKTTIIGIGYQVMEL